MTDEKLLRDIQTARHLARTDLFYLATEILGYNLITRKVHQPVIDHLASFRDCQGEDIVSEDFFRYTPRTTDPADILPVSPRRRLILDPRGWYKTTLNCISHSVQLLLNFPDITLHCTHASYEIITQEVVSRIKGHFTTNPKMRLIFPEFCAPLDSKGRPRNLGTMDSFTLPNKKVQAGTPSVSAGSIATTGAGTHYHWIKFTDIVTEQNCSGDQLKKIIDRFDMYENLLMSPLYFMDVEGTCYDYGDVYNYRIIETELKKPKEERTWHIFCRGCFYKQPPEGEKEQFDPEERDWDYLYGEDGKPISRFEERFPLAKLLERKLTNEWQFACQQLNNPIAADAENRPFPKHLMSWIPEKDVKYVNFTHFTMRVDTAEKITKRADFTAATVVGWDRFNRAYLVDATQGKFLPEKTVDNMFEMYHKWKCVECGIEESSFNRGLFPSIKRVMDQEPHKWMNIVWIKRDTQEAKAERIMALQPWYSNGLLRFSTGLSDYIKEQLEKQLWQFPAGSHDDLIDSLADQFQGKNTFGSQYVRRSTQEIMKKAHDDLVERTAEWEAIYQPKEPANDNLWLRIGG